MLRIQKYLSEQGILSRREAEKFLVQGLISVNGKVVRALGTKVDPKKDKVELLVAAKGELKNKKTILFYKPRGVVCSRSKEEGVTVFDALPQFSDLNLVGRLDKESEGLILLSNDGAITNAVTGKEHLITKEYEVTVREKLEPLHMKLMARGVELEDGIAKAVRAQVISANTFLLVLKEGRKHQIRRMCDALRLTTVKLKRVKIGTLDLRGLHPGDFRKLLPQETESLKSFLHK